MSTGRLLATILLVALWAGFVWLRFPGPETPQRLPVQARLQANLAARMLRIERFQGPGLPLRARQLLREKALEMVDEGLAHRPDSEWLLARKAILLAAEGREPEAAGLLTSLKSPDRTPFTENLARLYSGERVPPGAFASLNGYYGALVLERAAGEKPADQPAKAARDLAVLEGLAALTLANVGLGLLALLAWPLYRRRLSGASPGFSTNWDVTGTLACVVGYQWLSLVLGLPMSLVLGALQVPPVGRVLVIQILLYVLALGALRRVLPRVAGTPGRPLLGLGRPRATDLAAGLLGYWMAVPLVLAMSWVTSALLRRSPFSSNDALELLASASPLGLAAMALLVTVAGPFFEEVLFRGILFAGLRRALTPLGAGLASAVMFSLVHGDPQAVLVLSALGGLFAFLYERTGSLWPAIVAHGLWNGTTALVVTLLLMD